MAKQLQGVYIQQPPVLPGDSLLPTPPGAPPKMTNRGGITVGQANSTGPLPGPGILVPVGMVVRVRGNPANTGNAYLARTYEDAALKSSGKCDVVEPNTEIIYPLDNLAQMWVSFDVAGNLVTISVRNE